MNDNLSLDLVTWGESMVRLSSPPGGSLETAQALDFKIGGAESNVAVNLARLGWRTGWASRLPDNALGWRIVRELAGHGVDTSQVLLVPDDRCGVYFIDPGTAPRPTRVVYDRADSALSRMTLAELNLDYLSSAGTLHLTGITPALSQSCREAWLESARRAKAGGSRVVLDVNYRAKLWTPEEAREALEAVFPFVDVVLCGAADLRLIFTMEPNPEAAARSFAERYGVGLVVLTLGAEGALAFDAGEGRVETAPAVPTVVRDRIGAGDAFAAGFIFGLREEGLLYGLRCGNALAALKQTFEGDVSLTGREELLEVVASGGGDPRGIRR